MRIRPVAIATLLLALSAAVMLAVPGQASAAKPCWERVLDDWLNNGRVTGVYSVRCLQNALKNVPEDLRDYSNVTDAINAAIQARLHPTKTNPGTGTGPTGPTTPPKDNTPRKPQITGPGASPYHHWIDNLGTTSADSLPIPLLVLASLGGVLLLTAAGMLGAKRIRARRGPTPPAP